MTTRMFSAMKTSWNKAGPFMEGLPYAPGGIKAAYAASYGPHKIGSEGLLHSIKRSFMDTVGHDYSMRIQGPGGANIKYGGSAFSSSGWREITHEVSPAAKFTGYGPSNVGYELGKRRTLGASIGKGAMKYGLPLFAAASFIHTASTEGFGSAIKDAIVFNAGIGAAKWGLAKLGVAAGGALAGGAIAGVIAGGILGGRAALRAGRDYNKKLRIASMGNPMTDNYGNIATIRQASIMAIQSSRINGRNALGNEASLLHN